MLAYRNEDRLSLQEVLESKWAMEMQERMQTDRAFLSKAQTSLKQKLSYSQNVTKVKIDVGELRKKLLLEERKKEVESVTPFKLYLRPPQNNLGLMFHQALLP